MPWFDCVGKLTWKGLSKPDGTQSDFTVADSSGVQLRLSLSTQKLAGIEVGSTVRVGGNMVEAEGKKYFHATKITALKDG